MKKLLLIALFVPAFAFAGGKLSLQGNYYPDIGKPAPVVGMGIYQNLLLGWAFNHWTGMGFQPRKGQSSVMWFTSRTDLEKNLNNGFTVAFGFTLRKAEQPILGELPSGHDVHLKVSYNLW